ncbi:MAG: DNA topoisomerase [Oscillospiraceae bacterium]
MQLIISEKPSTARTIAHTVGAREKLYGSGKAFCYTGNGYYVVNARGHLYGLGEPEDYGFSKKYKLEELPMFPEFRIFPCGEDTEELRELISELINRDDVEEIICATDAGREGELIFRHIYNANNCTKPVKRLWCNSMTDEAIREQMKNLPPDSDFDGEYEAALARQKSDWLIGMNLSRLYGILDNFTHHVGRVKTPVLSIIVDRDKEIEKFRKSVTYRLEMDNGAVSEQEYSSKEEAEKILEESRGTDANVLSAICENNKTKNRPLLHSLTTLQQEANRVYGYTAKEVLEAAQSLYEKKFTTYPRTDCNYISEDMRGQIIRVVSTVGERPEYAQRAHGIIGVGLNLDSRVINDKAMEGHDHHAILPEASTESTASLSEKEKNVYGLIVNRLLCAVDKPYTYTETNYVFWCNDVTYKLKNVKSLELGWKAYDTEANEEKSEEISYAEGSTFTPEDIHIKVCETQPPKHYTDASLLSVMNNIDNRIDDEELKTAVKGKGIGTEATRADVIEELVKAGYVERVKRSIISTKFGKEFIESIPENLKSVERTAEWEQTFTNIKEKGISSDVLIRDVKDFVSSVIRLENNPAHKRKPVEHESAAREAVGICPRCGKNIYEGKLSFYCESGKEGCGFTLWKSDKFLKDSVTKEKAVRLLKGEAVKMKAESKSGEIYEAEYILEDTDKYVNLKRIIKEKTAVGKCPRCGKNVYEGKLNFYCESGKDGCGFTLWKEDKYNGITITSANAAELLCGKTIYKTKKKLNGVSEKKGYKMIDTGKYVNIRALEDEKQT